ncbi:DUF2059 domain-containing protein [Acinetobacter sp. A3.8]|uniref:DUF2059 domain-containing protein n=1 Tax=Acinetobacter sedimenti TaxID=2919922 RepID=A0A9X1X1Z1_9GAMM|nr:DUF2059 domain-containing protein [Acinetobacter sedimenti]MCJ8146486.1 DUF2059 domain-containing protein [Acinetobacter sedimenti]
MKKLLITTALSVALFSPMTAMAMPASDASVKELLKMTNSEQMMDHMNAHMQNIISQSIQQVQKQQGEVLSDAQVEIVHKYSKKVADIMAKGMKWSDIEPAILKIYQDNFTQEDINGLIAFYKSPVGQKTIEKMPVVMQQSMTAGQEAMMKVMPELTDEMKGFMSELRAVEADTHQHEDVENRE